MNHSEPLLSLPVKELGLQFECDSNEKFLENLVLSLFFLTCFKGTGVSHVKEENEQKNECRVQKLRIALVFENQ